LAEALHPRPHPPSHHPCRGLGLATLALLGLLAARPAAAVPALTHPVNDLVDVLSTADEERIGRILAVHREATGVPIAILLVESTDGLPFEEFAIGTAEAWRGGDPVRDTGALLVIATRERRVRLEVGYGLQPRLTDAEARRLLARAQPLVEQGAWADAVLRLVFGLVDATSDLRPDAAATKLHLRNYMDRDFPEWWIALGIAIVALVGIWISGRGRRRQLRRRTERGP
jgi:uncharacterized membrane protein YgcG